MSDSTTSGLLVDIGAFFDAIWKDWVALTSALVSIIGWVLGSICSMSVSAHWIFLGGGTVAMLIACFTVWRRARGVTNVRNAYLQLLRISQEGEKLVAADDPGAPGDERGAYRAGLALQSWHNETLKLLEKSYSAHWSNFADIGKYESRGTEGTREQAGTLLQRIRNLIDTLKLIISV